MYIGAAVSRCQKGMGIAQRLTAPYSIGFARLTCWYARAKRRERLCYCYRSIRLVAEGGGKYSGETSNKPGTGFHRGQGEEPLNFARLRAYVRRGSRGKGQVGCRPCR